MRSFGKADQCMAEPLFPLTLQALTSRSWPRNRAACTASCGTCSTRRSRGLPRSPSPGSSVTGVHSPSETQQGRARVGALSSAAVIARKKERRFFQLLIRERAARAAGWSRGRCTQGGGGGLNAELRIKARHVYVTLSRQEKK